MKVTGNTILITGGASGIGFALTKRFAERGNKVIVCGRREDKLRGAKGQLPDIETLVCDIGNESDRRSLFKEVNDRHPGVNVLINNAGIQRRVDIATNKEAWVKTAYEIAVNLEAPIHLSELFAEALAKKENAAIINVTSGLSFVPLADVPVYSATKAALHSFTLSLRHQLKGHGVEVVEIIPPAVDTDLQAPGLHTFGVNVDEFADDIFKQLEEGKVETSFGTAQFSSTASREQLDQIFERMNSAAH